MFDVEFKLLGWEEIEKTLKKLPKNLARNVLRGGARAAAKAYAEDVRSRVPVDSGELRDNIIVRQNKGTDKSASYSVGTSKKIRYGHLLEFGTVKMKAQPFMRPPFDENSNKYLNLMGEAMAKSLARQAKRAAGKFSKSGF